MSCVEKYELHKFLHGILWWAVEGAKRRKESREHTSAIKFINFSLVSTSQIIAVQACQPACRKWEECAREVKEVNFSRPRGSRTNLMIRQIVASHESLQIRRLHSSADDL